MTRHSEITFPGLHKAKVNSGDNADLPGSPDGLGDMYWAADNGTLYLTDSAGTSWAALTTTGLFLMKVSAGDTTPGYLSDKLAEGTNVNFNILNPGADEQLEITFSLPGIDASFVGYTPADTSDWDGGVDPGLTDDALDQLANRMHNQEDRQGKSLVQGDDATFGYLIDKLVEGSGISFSVIGTTNKQLVITNDGGGGGGGTDGNANELIWGGW